MSETKDTTLSDGNKLRTYAHGGVDVCGDDGEYRSVATTPQACADLAHAAMAAAGPPNEFEVLRARVAELEVALADAERERDEAFDVQNKAVAGHIHEAAHVDQRIADAVSAEQEACTRDVERAERGDHVDTLRRAVERIRARGGR